VRSLRTRPRPALADGTERAWKGDRVTLEAGLAFTLIKAPWAREGSAARRQAAWAAAHSPAARTWRLAATSARRAAFTSSALPKCCQSSGSRWTVYRYPIGGARTDGAGLRG